MATNATAEKLIAEFELLGLINRGTQDDIWWNGMRDYIVATVLTCGRITVLVDPYAGDIKLTDVPADECTDAADECTGGLDWVAEFDRDTPAPVVLAAVAAALAHARSTGRAPKKRSGWARARAAWFGGCSCRCQDGEFCGGCGHAGCAVRR